jgi:hypothetical protein
MRQKTPPPTPSRRDTNTKLPHWPARRVESFCTSIGPRGRAPRTRILHRTFRIAPGTPPLAAALARAPGLRQSKTRRDEPEARVEPPLFAHPNISPIRQFPRSRESIPCTVGSRDQACTRRCRGIQVCRARSPISSRVCIGLWPNALLTNPAGATCRAGTALQPRTTRG